MTWARAVGIVAGVMADRLLGDPRRFHPVAGFGRLASRLEPQVYDDRRAAGASYAGVLVGAAVLGGAVLETGLRRRPVARAVATAVVTWAVLGSRSLEREAEEMAVRLEGGDLPAARERLSHLCSRDAAGLGAAELARATVESVAENTSDACVAPLLWGGALGLPGLLGYRAVNTLDAMVGYRNARYERFGWASARLDDVANYLPARACAALTGAVSGRPVRAWRAWRRDAGRHPSPNAGPVEAAFAGALGVTLGGSNSYGDQIEDRGMLGDGPGPQVADVRRVAALSRRVGLAATVVAVFLSSRPRKPGGGERWT
ncbi:MAG: cobalamin biosynthesis protein [Kribbellaceae bacterium]